MIDALGRGEQIIILRKGGIHEGRGGFQVDQPEFWLFPTLFHQQGDSVTAGAAERFREIADEFPPEDTLRLEYFATVADWRKLENEEAALRLDGQHIWKENVVRERFSWGREQGIFALAVRVHRLPQPVDLPMLKEYGGCKSWIDLDETPATKGPTPVLDDLAFETKLDAFRARLKTEEQAGESGSGDHCHCTSDSGNQQQQEYRPGLGQAGPDEAVGEVVVIPDPDRLAKPAPDEDHRDEVGQRNEKHQQRRGNEPLVRAGRRVKVRKDGQHGKKKPYDMAAAIAQKNATLREVERQKTGQRTGKQKRQ